MHRSGEVVDPRVVADAVVQGCISLDRAIQVRELYVWLRGCGSHCRRCGAGLHLARPRHTGARVVRVAAWVRK